METASNVGSVQCDVCKILIGYVQQAIDNNSTEVSKVHGKFLQEEGMARVFFFTYLIIMGDCQLIN